MRISIHQPVADPGNTWHPRTRRSHASRLIVDDLGMPPSLDTTETLLNILLVLSDTIIVNRVADPPLKSAKQVNCGFLRRPVLVSEWRLTIRTARECADHIRTYWFTDPGRWILMSPHVPSGQSLRCICSAWQAGRCHRHVHSLGIQYGFAALTYDDAILEGYTNMAPTEAEARIRQALGPQRIGVLLPTSVEC